MNGDQQIQIRTFLLSKKLPIDVLLEVEDHFTDQVIKLQQNKNISFIEAFLITKNSWENDFKLVKKSVFSFGKVPRIVKSIQKEKTNELIKKSLIIAVAVLLFQLISAKIMLMDHYFIANIIIYLLVGFLILMMLFIYIFSSIQKQRTRAEQYFYNQILNIFLWYIILGIFGVFTKLPTNSFKVIYDYVNGLQEFSTDYFVAATLSIIFKTTITLYFFYMLRDRAKSLRKIKRYQVS